MAKIIVPEALRAPRLVGRGLDVDALRRSYSEAHWAALSRGQIVTSEDEGGVHRAPHQHRRWAAVFVAQPPEVVWSVLADFERRPLFLPGAKEIRIVRVVGNCVWLDERVKLPLVAIRYRCANTLEPELGTMSWALDKSAPHDIADTVGGWRMALIDPQRTLVTYRVWVDTGQPIPGFLENLLVRHSLPGLIGGLRTEVERHDPKTQER